MNNNNREILLKRLLYRSIHRGCKETDILLGEFAKVKINSFSDQQLATYQNFIEEDDLNIYNWLLKKQQTPTIYQELVNKICEFHFK